MCLTGKLPFRRNIMRIKSEENKVERILYFVFFMIGMVMLIIATALAVHTMRFKGNARVVSAVITGIDRGTKVEFILDGQTHTVWISEYNSRLHVGDEVDVYVDRDNPGHVQMGGTLFLPVLVLCVIGAAFLSLGVGFLIVLLAKKSKRKKFMQTGRCVYAEVTGGELYTLYNVNGRCPYRLECCYTDEMTGIKYLYRSGNIWIDPHYFIGRQVAVWVNPADLSKYYVDVDSLQQEDSNIIDYR